MSAELDDLLHALADDALSPEQERRLAEILRGSPEARARYLEFVELLGGLRWEYAVNAASPGAIRPRPRFLRYAAAVAAAVLLTLGLQAALRTEAPVGRIQAVDGARWQGAALAAGDGLRPGTFALEAGTAVLRLDNGAVLSLRAPSRLEIASADDVTLHLGTVTVRAPQEAVGFRLRTPSSTFIDLGTEFGVTVDANTASEVHVFDGVVVARPRSSNLVVPLHRNEAGRIEAFGSDVQPMAVDRRPFANVVAGAGAPEPAPPATALPPLPPGSRVIVLGDRATALETHLLMVEQALESVAGADVPALVNAGVAFPLLFEEKHFERFVVRVKPTHAVLEFGAELAQGPKPWTRERFEQAMTRLIDRLRQAGIEPVVETIWPTGDLGDAFNAVVRRLASERGLRVADVDRRFRAAAARGAALLADERSIPSYQGHRLMAEALLEALGHPAARIPDTLEVGLLEGVIPNWSIRHLPKGQAFDPATAEPDAAWTPLSLPQPPDKFLQRVVDRSQSIAFRDRQRGLATNLFRRAQDVWALGFLDAPEAREAWLNLGGTVQSVWLNGERVFVHEEHTGGHVGKVRVPVRLRAGRNSVVVQANQSFFASLTPEAAWRLSGSRAR